MTRYSTFKDKVFDLIIYTILALVAISSLLPIVNAVAISFSNSSQAAAGLVTFYPIGFNIESYKAILDDSSFFVAFWVSVKRVFLSTILVFVIGIFTAYPLSKEKEEFKFRNIYMWALIFTMMFQASLIPRYMAIRNLNLLGSIWALVLPGAVNHFLIILIMNFFRNLPKELDESASIDGAGPWRKLFSIYLPLSKPIMATVILFTVVWNWNAFFDGLVYMTRTEQYPLQTYIQQMVVTINPGEIVDLETIRKRLAVSSRTLNAAKIVVTMLPIMIIYPKLQKYFIKGIFLGSVKE